MLEAVAEKPEVSDDVNFDELDEKTKGIIKSLRGENAKYRTRNKEVSTENDELKKYRDAARQAEEAKLKEEGEYKKLLDEKEKAIADLQGKAEKSKTYEEYFTKELDIKLKGLNEVDVEFVQSSDLPLVKKIELAQRLANKPATNSPAVDRPGASTPSAADIFTSLDAEKSPTKKAEMMYSLKAKNPKLYEEYTKKFKE